MNKSVTAAGKVAVILPTFNRERYLGAAIESILAQTAAPFEILVVDDGSTDGTAEVAARYAPRVRYCRKENGGKIAAILFGMERTTAPFIWVMDDDDIAVPDALETLLAPMLADDGLGYTYGALQMFRENDDGVRTFDPVGKEEDDPRSLFVRVMEDCFITGQPCQMFRRSALERAAPFDASIFISEDYHMLLRIARVNEGAGVGKVVLLQRQHAGNRGPAAIAYAHSERCKRWMESDTRQLGELLPQVSYQEFIGRKDDRPLTEVETRQALFQKAAIAMRKNLFELAFEALEQAHDAAPNAPLSAADRFILAHALGSRYGIDRFLFDATLQRRLIAAAGDDKLGRAVREAIASRFTYWIARFARQGDFQRGGAAVRALSRMGAQAMAASIAGVVTRRLRGAEGRRPDVVASFAGAGSKA